MTDENGDLPQQLSPAQTDERDQITFDLEAVLSTAPGRHVTLWFLEICGLYGHVFTGDDNATNFNLGARNVGLRVLAKLDEVSLTAYPNLLLGQAREKDLQPKEAVHVVDAEE